MTHPVPRGFELAAVHCGIKTDASVEDLTLIATDGESAAAGVYTKNVVYSASVRQNRAKTPLNNFRAVVVNSGNANACTGRQGEDDSAEMARLAAEAVGASADQALVMSTGIIGEHLPMDKIAAGIVAAKGQLASNDDALQAAARGITTTDKFVKIASRVIKLSDTSVAVTGIAKGAGMIGPNMATMLCVVMTDAALTAQAAEVAILTLDTRRLQEVWLKSTRCSMYQLPRNRT